MTYYQGFYNKLNQSQKLQEIYERFYSYRQKLTSIILEEVEDLSSCSQLVVFGAGNLMDIDYERITSAYKELQIIITDIDQLSMSQGLDYLNISNDFVKMKAFNYLGASDIEGRINLLINQLNLPMISREESLFRIESFFDEIVEDLSKFSYLDQLKSEADLILVLPIYTQLLYIELDTKLKGSKGYPYIKDSLLQKMIYVIDKFNQKIVSCLKKGGRLLVFSDIIEEKILASDQNMNELIIKEKISTYEKTYGVGLGGYGLLNIEEYLIQSKEYYLNWEFDTNRRFLIKGFLLNR